MTLVLPDVSTIEHLDFKHSLTCEVWGCSSEDPRPAVAVLAEHWGCCQRRRPICERHRDLVTVLRDIHLQILCGHHGTLLCAHLAFTLEPLS